MFVTNSPVGAGGAYFVISRSLGIDVDADFVLLGLYSSKDSTDPEAYQRYFEGQIEKITSLPATGLVMARENIEFD